MKVGKGVKNSPKMGGKGAKMQQFLDRKGARTHLYLVLKKITSYA